RWTGRAVGDHGIAPGACRHGAPACGKKGAREEGEARRAQGGSAQTGRKEGRREEDRREGRREKGRREEDRREEGRREKDGDAQGRGEEQRSWKEVRGWCTEVGAKGRHRPQREQNHEEVGGEEEC